MKYIRRYLVKIGYCKNLGVAILNLLLIFKYRISRRRLKSLMKSDLPVKIRSLSMPRAKFTPNEVLIFAFTLYA